MNTIAYIVNFVGLALCASALGWLLKEKQDGNPSYRRIGGSITLIIILGLSGYVHTINSKRIPNGLPLADTMLKTNKIYQLEDEPTSIGGTWGFLARESEADDSFGAVKFYSSKLKPPEEFQPIYSDGKLHFNPAADLVEPENGQELPTTQRLIEEMSSE